MTKVFISYRRADSSGWVQMLDDRLAPALGSENVFCDLRSIGMGRDFQQEIQAQVSQSDVVLVVISQNWASMPGRNGKSRLFEPEDLVRQEVELALLADVEVVPVLCGQVAMPSAQQLPPGMRGLLKRQAFQVTTRHRERDLDELVAGLTRFRRPDAAPGTERPSDADEALAAEAQLPAQAAVQAPAPDPLPESEPEPEPERRRADLWTACRDALRARRGGAALSANTPLGDRPLWLRVTSGPKGLQFALVHAGAGAPPTPEVQVAGAGLSALQSLLRGYAWQHAPETVAEIGPMLFRMLVPSAWRPLIAWSSGLLLLLDDDANAWPWERLWIPGEPLPLSLMRPVVRDVVTDLPPALQQPAIARVLVVMGAAPADIYADLPGAREEVRAVADAWQAHGVEVDARFEAPAVNVVCALADKPFGAVHLSGHSALDWMPKASGGTERQQPLSGFVIGDAAVLAAQDLLLHDEVPQLVTVASDHLGNWAPGLRRAGVRFAVVCESPLQDAPAKAFFETFHQAFAAGHPAVVAMQRARGAAVESAPDGMLVAVHMQCFGEPALCWPVAARGAPAPADADRPKRTKKR